MVSGRSSDGFGIALLGDGEYEPQMVAALETFLPAGGIFINLGANEASQLRRRGYDLNAVPSFLEECGYRRAAGFASLSCRDHL